MTDIEKQGARSRKNLERVLMQQAVVRDLKKFADDEKTALHHHLADGETIKVANSRGGELGSIYRTRGKQRAVVETPEVVLGEAAAAGAELEDRLPVEGSANYWQAVEVLQEHAPHLLRTVLLEMEEERIADEVLAEYHASGVVAPGWRISEGKGGYTSVRLAPLGKEVAARMVSQARGVMELEAGNE